MIELPFCPTPSRHSGFRRNDDFNVISVVS